MNNYWLTSLLSIGIWLVFLTPIAKILPETFFLVPGLKSQGDMIHP